MIRCIVYLCLYFVGWVLSFFILFFVLFLCVCILSEEYIVNLVIKWNDVFFFIFDLYMNLY